MALGLPVHFPSILTGMMSLKLGELLRDFIQDDIGDLTKKKEQELNAEILGKKKGDEFLSFIVTDVNAAANTFTLLYRVADQDVAYPVLSTFPPKMEKVPGLKIGLARAEVVLERWINITDSSKPIAKFIEIPAFDLALAIQRDEYFIELGGGVDKRLKYQQYLVDLDIMPLELRARGFWAQSDKGGFVISAHSELPFPIPFGNTGFGLTGVGLLYGERFAPWLTGVVKPDDPIEAMQTASALDYVGWAQRHELERWLPVDEALRIFGISADIGDVATVGRIITTYKAGLTFLTYGPTIVWGGKLRLLNSLDVASMYGALDLRSKSLGASASVSFDLIPQGITFQGSATFSASLTDQNKTWMALGGYDMTGCRVSLLDGKLELWGGYRIVLLQGAAARASARVAGKGQLFGFKGGYNLSIEMGAQIGWNPIELGGYLDVGGNVWVEAFGLEVGAGVSAHLAFHVLKPTQLELTAQFRIDFPWPIPDKKFDVTVFRLSDADYPAPLQALSQEPLAPISYVHRCSGTLGQLVDGDKTGIWPDVSFDIPFKIITQAPPLVVNQASGDGSRREGGIQTVHVATQLEIKRIDEATGIEHPMPTVSAAWMGMNVSDRVGRTSRIAIPCNDPLGWLQKFEYSTPGSAQPVQEQRFQTFGSGPDYEFSNATGRPIFELEELRFRDRNPFFLLNQHWISPYERALVGRRITIEFLANVPGGKVPLPVTEVDVRIVVRGEGHVAIDGVATVNNSFVRDLERGLSEYSALIERPLSEAFKPLTIRGMEETLCIVGVGYTRNLLAETEPGNETVLRPGRYKLYVNGTSTSHFGGSSKSKSWDPIAREFSVIAPPLRPYIRYASFGDERLFGVQHPGWNPNPQGFGFGHYRSHRGVVRARVSYLSQIYDKLWISPSNGVPPFAVPVVACTDGSIAGSSLSQEWQAIVGGAPKPEEEAVFDITAGPGPEMVRIYRSEKGDGSDAIEIDRWSYRISRYTSPIDHLTPSRRQLKRVFGPGGVEDLQHSASPSLPGGIDFDAVPEAKAGAGWILPPWIRTQDDMSSANVGLSFLKLFEWAGVFREEVVDKEDSIFFRPPEAELDLLVNDTGIPAAFLLMTDEPCDWRRVELTVLHGSFPFFLRRFTTKLLPSPDGCACLVLLIASDVPVRVPRGDFAIRLRYHYRKGNLASLVDSADPAAKYAEVQFAVYNSMGRDWNV